MSGKTYTYSITVKVEVVTGTTRGFSSSHWTSTKMIEGRITSTLITKTFMLIDLVENSFDSIIIWRWIEGIVVLHSNSSFSCLIIVNLSASSLKSDVWSCVNFCNSSHSEFLFYLTIKFLNRLGCLVVSHYVLIVLVLVPLIPTALLILLLSFPHLIHSLWLILHFLVLFLHFPFTFVEIRHSKLHILVVLFIFSRSLRRE